MLPENILQSLINHRLRFSDYLQHIVPCFIGETGTGKTTRVENDASSRNMNTHRLLLQSMLPEDVLGLPRVINGVTHWSLPQWAEDLRANPGFLFLDEMDKARPETMSAVLTLLAERRIRDVVLHPQTILVAAMQPVSQAEFLADQTGQALAARMCFIPVSQDWNYLAGKYGIDLEFMPKGSSVELPILPKPSPRQVEWFIHFCRANAKDKDMWEAVAAGMFPKAESDALIETISKGMCTGGVTREDLVELIKEQGPAIIKKLTIPELVMMAPETFNHGSPAALEESLVRVWMEGDEDAAKNYLENQYNVLKERVEAAGGELETNGGASDKEVQDAIERASARVGAGWKARAEGAKAVAEEPKKKKAAGGRR